jgi:catechol 2,3-dioxygenase-like lactoylglutathione lyase family enzyme
LESGRDPGAETGTWPKRIGAITLFVEDIGTAKRFYREIFSLSTAFEDDDSAVFDFGNTIVNLLSVGAAPELVAPARVERPLDGCCFVLTAEVEDVDATCAELARRGVALLNGPMDRPWGVRTASFRDPDGHVGEIAK